MIEYRSIFFCRSVKVQKFENMTRSLDFNLLWWPKISQIRNMADNKEQERVWLSKHNRTPSPLHTRWGMPARNSFRRFLSRINQKIRFFRCSFKVTQKIVAIQCWKIWHNFCRSNSNILKLENIGTWVQVIVSLLGREKSPSLLVDWSVSS